MLSDRLGLPVAVGKLTVGVWPPSVKLQNVAVKSAFKAGEVEIPLRWQAFLKFKVEPQALFVRNWRLVWQRRVDGSWEGINTALLVSNYSSRRSNPLPIDRLSFQQGVLAWLDPHGRAVPGLELRSLAGEYRPRQDVLTYTGDVSGLATPVRVKFEGASWTQGTFALSDGDRRWNITVQAEGEKIRVNGQAPQWRWDNAWALAQFFGRFHGTLAVPPQPVLLKEWKTEFVAGSSTQSFTTTGQWGDGRMEARATLVAQPSGLTVRSTVALDRVPVDALPDSHGLTRALDGKLSGLAEFECVASSGLGRHIRGHGTAEITDGVFVFPKASIAAIKKSKTLAYFRKKNPRFEEDGYAFSKLRLVGRVERSILTFVEAWAQAPDSRVSFSGIYDIERGGLDLQTRLDIKEKNAALRRLLSGRYVSGPVGREKVRPIFGHLQGTPDDWQIKATRRQ